MPLRVYTSSPGPGTPWDTYVEESTIGGFTGAPCARGGLPAVTASVAGDRPIGCSDVSFTRAG
ncbi:hypothetical protein CELD12_22670 [Cellulomonas sp. NTE-D12]|nr:hypothetical protein CELD12_22670 [Cellulomonas sp. NTE-D12]